MADKSLDEGEYMIINNIPKHFRSADLRSFFSAFIETGGFLCFHFRHRPEVQKPGKSEEESSSEKFRRVTNCCIIKVAKSRAEEFLKSYNGEHWVDIKGDTLMTRCFIKRIKLSSNSDAVVSGSGQCKRGTVSESIPLQQETFTLDDLNSLIEMHPPSLMPCGNVGTKTSHFLEAIRACKLPPSLISKLGLQFPRNRARRIYGNVPFEYKIKHSMQNVSSAHKSQKMPNEVRYSKQMWASRYKQQTSDPEDKDDEESESEEEEWDRHEALHEDVTGQERTKERLFEEKIELKWEKGGSGLVFYTDAQFWDAKEGDFDAKTSDDWDVDMSVYTESGLAGDKDSRDLLKMRQECALRDGTETEVDRLYDFAAFEKYGKGFGRKLMEAQGWKQGQGIGKDCKGIPEPVLGEGQHPTDKKGFGYRGEKLNRQPRASNKRRKRRFSDDEEYEFFISTAYDNPLESDPSETILASSAFSKLKYRREFLRGHQCDTG